MTCPAGWRTTHGTAGLHERRHQAKNKNKKPPSLLVRIDNNVPLACGRLAGDGESGGTFMCTTWLHELGMRQAPHAAL